MYTDNVVFKASKIPDNSLLRTVAAGAFEVEKDGDVVVHPVVRSAYHNANLL